MSDDKPTAILTNSQREYIQGENEPSNPREYDRRIRNRLEYGLYDLYLLFEHLDDDEVRKAFGSNFAPAVTDAEELKDGIPEPPATSAWVPGAMAFILRGLNYGDEPIHPGLDELGEQQPAFTHFTEAIENGVRKYLNEKQERLADVNVTIELENVEPTDELIDRTKDE